MSLIFVIHPEYVYLPLINSKRDYRFINSKNHLFQADRKVLLLVVEEIAWEDRSVASLSAEEEEAFSSQIWAPAAASRGAKWWGEPWWWGWELELCTFFHCWVSSKALEVSFSISSINSSVSRSPPPPSPKTPTSRATLNKSPSFCNVSYSLWIFL